MAKRATATKHDRLHFALKQLGEGVRTVSWFREFMSSHKLNDDDIDDYCRHHARGTLKLALAEKAT